MQEYKTALISGAAKGIGRGIAKALAESGYRLFLHYHSSEKAMEELLHELNAGRSAENLHLAFQADLNSGDESERMTAAVKEAAGARGLDLLINNAGISEWGLFCELDPARWDEVFRINIGAAYRLTRAFAPAMIRRHSGVIINVASIWGLCGASCEAAYAASKAGLISLTRSLARELGPSGIRVNAVAPGVIRTDMLNGFTEDELRDLMDKTPLSRLGTVEDVASAVRFLASDEASFISGQCLTVDGGFTA